MGARCKSCGKSIELNKDGRWVHINPTTDETKVHRAVKKPGSYERITQQDIKEASQ